MFFKGALIVVSAVLSASPLAVAAPMASDSTTVDFVTHASRDNAAGHLRSFLESRMAVKALAARDDYWHIGIRSWTYTYCGPNGLNCDTEHTEDTMAWGGCLGDQCDAVRVSLDLDGNGGCDRDMDICGKKVRLVYSGDEFSCKPAGQLGGHSQAGYAFVKEGDSTVGACMVDFSRNGKNCIASAAYGFESRLACSNF